MSTDKLQFYRETFQRAGLRMTQPRQVICAWLAETDVHPTPYRVYEEISQSHPEISRATVYNTLNTLRQLGAIVELGVGDDHTHYETDPRPHVNLICLRCHKIADLELDEEFAHLRSKSGDEHGFHALVARAEVLGLCAGCFAAQQALAQTAGPSHSTLPAEPDAFECHETGAAPPIDSDEGDHFRANSVAPDLHNRKGSPS
jgi:Fur family peroxide stress response transcriptional regulator